MDALFTRVSGQRLVGYDLFVDPVHPNIRGHQLIAEAVADAIREAGLPHPQTSWHRGAYVDPDVDTLRAADPELIVKELLATGFACHAAARLDCSIPTMRAAAQYTGNPGTRAALEKALARLQGPGHATLELPAPPRPSGE